MKQKYSLPFSNANENNLFNGDGFILITYDYLTQNIEQANRINLDIIVFEEVRIGRG